VRFSGYRAVWRAAICRLRHTSGAVANKNSSNKACSNRRSGKFNQCKKLPLLRHYILVSQTAWVLEWFRRDEAGQWNYEVLSDPANVLKTPDLNLRLSLSDVYDDPDVAPLLLAPELEKP